MCDYQHSQNENQRSYIYAITIIIIDWYFNMHH